jgi:hypothetical protein
VPPSGIAPPPSVHLAPGVPASLARSHKIISATAERLEAKVADGSAGERDRRRLAQFRATLRLIEQNRYWYVGPRTLCPPIPASSELVGYFMAPLPDDNLAVFELSQLEFPGSYDPRALADGNAEDPKRQGLEAARRAVRK